MKKTLIFSAVLMACSAFSAWADNAPAYKTFQVGKLEVTSLLDKNNALPNDGKVLGVDVGPKAVGKMPQLLFAHAKAGASDVQRFNVFAAETAAGWAWHRQLDFAQQLAAGAVMQPVGARGVV